MLVEFPPRPSSVLRVNVSPRARAQIGLNIIGFGTGPYLVGLESDLHVGVESSVQHAFSGTWMMWVLNHLYLAAQLIVLPGSLVFLYHRSTELYERLRNTILATWLLSIPVYALYTVAPPRVAHVGLLDTIRD